MTLEAAAAKGSHFPAAAAVVGVVVAVRVTLRGDGKMVVGLVEVWVMVSWM